MEYYFDRDDRLERLKYAEFLKTLLINCDKYRREDSDGAYVIALDSPWGTGKTRFVKMLRNYLEGRESKDEDDSPVKDDAAFNVVYYNSWETDFSNDALEPLIYTILQAPELEESRFDEAGRKILESFKNATKAVLKAAGFVLAHHFLGEQATEVIKAGVEGLCKSLDDPFKEYEARLQLINDFKETLEAVINSTKQNKLVIIVDELDRCRPTFAIQTLELAKHLFNVPGLIFIFALDIEQLSHSVQTVYGQNMDAQGYLCRFLDYITRIPSPDRKAFIKECLIKADPSLSIENSVSCERGEQKSSDIFIDFVNELATYNSLSYREITTIFSSYQVMLSSWLSKYKYLPAYELYFVFLLIKYKYAKDFGSLLSLNGVEGIPQFVHTKAHLPSNSILDKQLTYLTSKIPIYEMSINAYPLGATGEAILEKNGVHPILRDQVVDKKVKYKWHQIPIHILDKIVGDIVLSNSEITFDHFLYIDDFRNWDKIKNLTPAQYLERQLEMFDFVLPADEANAEP